MRSTNRPSHSVPWSHRDQHCSIRARATLVPAKPHIRGLGERKAPHLALGSEELRRSCLLYQVPIDSHCLLCYSQKVSTSRPSSYGSTIPFAQHCPNRPHPILVPAKYHGRAWIGGHLYRRRRPPSPCHTSCSNPADIAEWSKHSCGVDELRSCSPLHFAMSQSVPAHWDHHPILLHSCVPSRTRTPSCAPHQQAARYPRAPPSRSWMLVPSTCHGRQGLI